MSTKLTLLTWKGLVISSLRDYVIDPNNLTLLILKACLRVTLLSLLDVALPLFIQSKVSIAIDE